MILRSKRSLHVGTDSIDPPKSSATNELTADELCAGYGMGEPSLRKALPAPKTKKVKKDASDAPMYLSAVESLKSCGVAVPVWFMDLVSSHETKATPFQLYAYPYYGGGMFDVVDLLKRTTKKPIGGMDDFALGGPGRMIVLISKARMIIYDIVTKRCGIAREKDFFYHKIASSQHTPTPHERMGPMKMLQVEDRITEISFSDVRTELYEREERHTNIHRIAKVIRACMSGTEDTSPYYLYNGAEEKG